MNCTCGGWQYYTVDERGHVVKKCMACGKVEPNNRALELLPPELHEEYRRRKELEGQL